MKRRQTGFSLIELLITLFLSSLLIAAVSTLLLQSRRAFVKQNALSVMAEDGRYAVEMLAQEFRLAGYLVHPNRPDDGFRRQDLFGAEPNAASSGIGLQANEHIRGRYNGSGFTNPADMNHVVFRYQLNPSGSCRRPDNTLSPIIVKSECVEQGEVWTPGVTGLNEGGTPCSAMVDDENPPGSGVVAFTKAIFLFVNNTGDGPSLSCRAATLLRPMDVPPAPTTIVDNNGGNAIPLVSNVEALHIYYGEDMDADGFANRYVTADQVAVWQNVVAARFYLVLRSAESNIATGDTSTYRFEGQTFNVHDPGARRLYRVFTTTVALRN